MGATAAVTISATASGLPEGGIDQVSYSFTNTSAAAFRTILGVTTALGSALSVSLPSSGQMILAIPPSTNTFPWRLTQSTSDTGILMSSVGCAFLRVPGGSSVHFYTTAGTTFTITVLGY